MDAQYWTNRYVTNNTGWDVGYASPPIVTHFSSVSDKTIKILIPGAGNAHEASHLYTEGFDNVHICDISRVPIDNFINSNPNFPKDQIILSNFFDLDETYDIIIEQTFFCALNPSFRSKYVKKMHDLLNENGCIVGLLFNRTFDKAGPPFGGSIKEYHTLFEPYFNFEKMELCTNSIAPRSGQEVFIQLYKK